MTTRKDMILAAYENPELLPDAEDHVLTTMSELDREKFALLKKRKMDGSLTNG